MADYSSCRTYPDLNKKETTERFVGYVVLVTGGCSGIGRATVERFANDGATVYALDIRAQGEEELKSLYGDRVSCIHLDVTDKERCQQVAAQIASKHDNTINTLFNCAAYFGSRGLSNADRESWLKSFDVNVVGYSNMVQAVEPFMNRGKNCSVVNVASISAKIGQVDRWTYSGTKGAILAVTRCMAVDLREKQIRVNSVSPGWVWSPEVAKAAEYDREKGEEKWGRFFLSGKTAEVEHIASVVAFLASKDAAYINGSDIPVDDGYIAMGPEQKGQWSSFAGTE